MFKYYFVYHFKMNHDNHSLTLILTVVVVVVVVAVTLILAELHHGARDLDILVVQGHEDVPVEGVGLPRDNSVDLLCSLEAGAALLQQALLPVGFTQAVKILMQINILVKCQVQC